MDTEGETQGEQGPFGDEELNTYELEVLRELAREASAEVTVKGLANRVPLEPGTLHETLSNLTDQGLVEGGTIGYRLTDRGSDLVPAPAQVQQEPERWKVLQAHLPRDLQSAKVLSRMRRARYKGIDRYGIAHGAGHRTLIWTVRDWDIVVRLRITDEEVLLSVTGTDRTTPTAALAAGGILRSVASLYGIPRKSREPPEDQMKGTGFGS